MDELPPLPRAKHCIAPYPESNLSWFWVYDKSGGQMDQSIPVFTADQMRAYAAAAVAREREKIIALADRMKPAGGRAWTAEQSACFACLSDLVDAIRKGE